MTDVSWLALALGVAGSVLAVVSMWDGKRFIFTISNKGDAK